MNPENTAPNRPPAGWDRRLRTTAPAIAAPDRTPPPTDAAGHVAPAEERQPPAAASALLLPLLLAGCVATTGASPDDPHAAAAPLAAAAATIRESAHRDSDDLLTAGLGDTGLRSATPPPFADPAAPTAPELRRRAIWSNWRGIADLSPGSAYGHGYGALQPVPGREFHAFATLPGRAQPHRVLVQLPDGFDLRKRCVIVTASSGSRGVYGAIALAGAWGLPRGCAVAYTDKGAGTGYVDGADGIGVALDGRRATAGEPVEFAVAGAGRAAGIFAKHAHSGDNPEADWGLHVRQAADFALQVLAAEHPGTWTHADTTVIAVGVSNGGGAVLRAAELDGDWLDGVVAVSPNVLPGSGGRALFDYGTEAAIWMPCALNAADFADVAMARPGGAAHPAGTLRCASLQAAGLIDGDTPEALAGAALATMRAHGWTDAAITAGALSTGFDLWRAVTVTYAAAYSRSGAGAMPCGYAFAAVGATGLPQAATPAMRAAWWSDASGIPPGAGVGIVDTRLAGSDPLLPGLACLRALQDDARSPLRAGIEQTRAGLPRVGLPVIVIHGADDGLVPEAFSGGAYVDWAEANGRPVTYWRIEGAQHFDAFVTLPAWAGRYQPLLPQGYRALEAMWRHLDEDAPLPADAGG